MGRRKQTIPDGWGGSPGGFTIIEIVIAMFVLAVFLLPLMQHFTRARRVSLAARDSVIVNSFQTSCVDELRLVGFDALLEETGATRTRILEKYAGERTINQLPIQTSITINRGTEPKIATIDVETSFRLPGTPDSAPKRKVVLRGFAFAEP